MREKNFTQCSFQSVDDHQVFAEDEFQKVAEEDDSEEGHHTRPVVEPTVHASSFLHTGTVVLVFVELAS